MGMSWGTSPGSHRQQSAGQGSHHPKKSTPKPLQIPVMVTHSQGAGLGLASPQSEAFLRILLLKQRLRAHSSRVHPQRCRIGTKPILERGTHHNPLQSRTRSEGTWGSMEPADPCLTPRAGMCREEDGSTSLRTLPGWRIPTSSLGRVAVGGCTDRRHGQTHSSLP